MKTTLYIPCYNAERTLLAVLDSIRAQTHAPDEVLIVDDGSTDTTAKIASGANVARLRILHQEKNLGLAAARNRALRQAQGEILIGVDADVFLREDYVAKVIARFSADRDLGAICGRLHEKYTATLADRWRATHMCQEYGATACENPRFLYGCTTSIRRHVAEALGGWNERFRRAHEDVDLTRRLRTAGVRTAYEPSCIGDHLRTDSIASVLTSFWHWFFPKGDLAGHFDSLETWAADGLQPVQWSLFCARLRQDLADGRDELLPITMLMPWWMTALDLLELRRRHQDGAERVARLLAALPGVACATVEKTTGLTELAAWTREAIGYTTGGAKSAIDGHDSSADAILQAIRSTSDAATVLNATQRERLARACQSLPAVDQTSAVTTVQTHANPACARETAGAGDPAITSVSSIQ